MDIRFSPALAFSGSASTPPRAKQGQFRPGTGGIGFVERPKAVAKPAVEPETPAAVIPVPPQPIGGTVDVGELPVREAGHRARKPRRLA